MPSTNTPLPILWPLAAAELNTPTCSTEIIFMHPLHALVIGVAGESTRFGGGGGVALDFAELGPFAPVEG